VALPDVQPGQDEWVYPAPTPYFPRTTTFDDAAVLRLLATHLRAEADKADREEVAMAYREAAQLAADWAEGL
jgi:hypothetical protein